MSAAVFDDPIVVLDLGRLGGQASDLRRYVEECYRRGVALGVFQERVDGPDDDAEILVAIDRRTGNRAGFATFYEIDDNRLWVGQLWVDEAWRRRGIALEILDRAIEVARARGFHAVLLGRAETNAPMLALLEGAGWTVDHVVHRIKVTP